MSNEQAGLDLLVEFLLVQASLVDTSFLAYDRIARENEAHAGKILERTLMDMEHTLL
jgi:hypothetical protein